MSYTIGRAEIVCFSICNDLFSRFEQQILFLENWLKQRNPRRTVTGTTVRHRCLVSIYLGILKLGTENRLSELRNGLAGRTVTGVTDRHSVLGENKVLALTTT